MGLLIFFSNLPIPRAGGKPLSMEDVAVVRSATLIYLTAGCLRYFVANFVNAVPRRVGVKALSPVLVLTRMAFGFCLAAAGITFLYLSTARDFGAWLGWPLIFLTLILALEPFVGLGARFYQPRESQDTALRLICNSLLLDASFGQGDDLRDAVRHFESLSTAHFLALAEEHKSDLFRTRLRFEVLEVGLSTPTKITLGIPSNV